MIRLVVEDREDIHLPLHQSGFKCAIKKKVYNPFLEYYCYVKNVLSEGLGRPITFLPQSG